jgi:hypothetical protein
MSVCRALVAEFISRLRLCRQAMWRHYVFSLRQNLPASVRRAIGRCYGYYVFWRISPGTTKMLGPRFRRSRDRIEIDITWDCNLRCFCCDRSCGQAPSEERMTVGQIRWFLEETRQRNIHWKSICLSGGEPTLHPQFHEILRMVLEFRNRDSPGATIMVNTNGFGAEVNAALASIPDGVDLCNTRKSGRRQDDFIPFNLAPRDSQEYAQVDFRNACCVTRDAGIGLTSSGYYPCVVAGAIDRIFGFDCGRKTLPDPEDGMEAELSRFCTLCGLFRLNYTMEVLSGSLASETWQKAYAAWQTERPVLRRFPEC